MITALFYLIMVAAAEAITTYISLLWGVLFHLAILVGFIVHSGLESHSDRRRFLLSLMLVPLVRIISLAMPLENVRLIYWYPIIYAPLLVACVVIMFILKETPHHIGLTLNKLPLQPFVLLSGLPFGIAEYYILRPDALVSELTFREVWLPALILVTCTGFVEELIFRGVLQRTAVDLFGVRGIILISLFFAALHMGYENWIDIIFVFMVAVFFGWVVKKTGSLLGVTLAHGLTNIMLYLVMPFILV